MARCCLELINFYSLRILARALVVILKNKMVQQNYIFEGRAIIANYTAVRQYDFWTIIGILYTAIFLTVIKFDFITNPVILRILGFGLLVIGSLFFFFESKHMFYKFEILRKIAPLIISKSNILCDTIEVNLDKIKTVTIQKDKRRHQFKPEKRINLIVEMDKQTFLWVLLIESKMQLESLKSAIDFFKEQHIEVKRLPTIAKNS